MSSNSLITSEFTGLPIKGIAYTNISLDTPILKYQPLNNAQSETIAPLALDSTSKPTTILWIDDSNFVILYENKPYFDLIDAKDLSKPAQHINLVTSSNPASCACADFDESSNTLYVLDTTNRLYTYSFDAFADNKLGEVSNYVITDLTESVSKVTVYKKSNQSPKLLIMSNSLYEFDLTSKTVERSLNLFVDKVNCFELLKSEDSLLLSSFNDRFINMVNLESFKVTSIFVLNSPVKKFHIGKFKKKVFLAAIDQDGFVELFKNPLAQQNDPSTSNAKKRRKGNQVKSIQHSSILKLYTDTSFTITSKIDDITFDFDNLVIAYLQGESYFILDKFNWYTNSLDLPEIKIPRRKSSVEHLSLRSQDRSSLRNYSETSEDIFIRSGDNFIELDPVYDENEAEKEGDEEEEEEVGDDFSTLVSRLDKTAKEFSNKAYDNSNRNASSGKKFKFQVGTLTTNLSQALRNNDSGMFDSLISVTQDEKVVKATISQLEQHSVLKILDKLSELVFKNKFANTNEAVEFGLGNSIIGLTTWIRYVLVYHGTYLVGAAGGSGELRRRLGLLGMSMSKRADNMDKLLALKGQLAMVTDKAAAIREIETVNNEDIEIDEDDVEYIEEEESLEELSEIEEDESMNDDNEVINHDSEEASETDEDSDADMQL